MKKIGIVTFWYADNYGALLQNYALKTFLEKLGAIAYTYKFKMPKNYTKKYLKKLALFFKLDILLKKKIFDESVFSRFRKKHIKKYTASKNLDFYVSGSDQIWNPENVRDDYLAEKFFLRFIPQNKRISYAVSIANGNLESGDKEKYIKNLEMFDHLSAREPFGVELIKNITGKNATMHIDPTFLLTREHWQSLKKDNHKIKKPYILCFFLGEISHCEEEIKKFAEEVNCSVKIVSFCNYISGDGIKPKTVNEFLALIDNAEYVFTDSFHGTAFSIIYQKQFYSVKRVQNGCPNISGRIDNLFSLFGVNRWWDENNIYEEDRIDYSGFEEIINNERKRTEEYFKEILEI